MTTARREGAHCCTFALLFLFFSPNVLSSAFFCFAAASAFFLAFSAASAPLGGMAWGQEDQDEGAAAPTRRAPVKAWR